MAPRFYPGVPFLDAAQYTKVPGSNGTVTRIVIHDMEVQETATTAEAVASSFHRTTRQASAHFCIDNNSIVQCVPLDCVAWHAPPNRGSIGLEHAGYVRQSRAEWLDPYGVAMLTRSAALTAWLCEQFDIPVVRLTSADLRAGKRGLAGHDAVSAAWHQTDHTDPAPNFPWDWYLAAVRRSFTGGIMATLDREDLDAISRVVKDAVNEKVMGYELPGLTEKNAKGETVPINLQTLVTRAYRMSVDASKGLDQDDINKIVNGVLTALSLKK